MSGCSDWDAATSTCLGDSFTATWQPNITQAGNYRVYAWWVANPSRPTNAPYNIQYNGGSQTIPVNQRLNGSKWNLLGTFNFAAGNSGYVQLNDNTNGYVCADAILWEPAP